MCRNLCESGFEKRFCKKVIQNIVINFIQHNQTFVMFFKCILNSPSFVFDVLAQQYLCAVNNATGEL